MGNSWVVNACPLIVLGKSGLLSVVSPLADCWIVPEGVAQEVSRKASIELLLAALSEKSRLERRCVVAIDPVVASWNLGRGESEVITVALEQAGCGVVLDDLLARKCAQVLNLPLMGTLGLVAKAKKQGLLAEVKPAFEQLMAAGLYVDPSLVKKVLAAVGE